MRLELLKQLLAVPSPSRREEAMVAFLAEHIRQRGVERCGQMVTDEWHNVCIRKGKPGIVPCVAAHLDTVFEPANVKVMEKLGVVFGKDERGDYAGIGCDDKAGVYVCLELLEKFDDIMVILFASEEVGGLGAQHAPAEWFKDVGYLIAYDCPSRGFVSYTCGGVRLFANDGEFIQKAAPVMAAHELTTWQHHPFTDVKILRRRFDFSCLNLSCGYYQWHRSDEFILVPEVEAAVTAGAALITALGHRSYPFALGTPDHAKPLYEITESGF
jgi:di/tripeptidase